MDGHECIDVEARRTIRTVRDEHAETTGAMMAEVAMVHQNLAGIRQFLGAPAFVRPNLNGHRSHPSLADIVEEATNPGIPSNPVVAAVDRWTGKQVRRAIGAGLLLVAGGGIKWLWDVAWTALHR